MVEEIVVVDPGIEADATPETYCCFGSITYIYN